MKLFQLTREYEDETSAVAVVESRDLLTDNNAVLDVCKTTWPEDFTSNLPAQYSVAQLICKATYCSTSFFSAENNRKGWRTLLRVTLPNDEKIKFTYEEGSELTQEDAKSAANKSFLKLLKYADELKQP